MQDGASMQCRIANPSGFQLFFGIDHRSSSLSKGALDPDGPGGSAALSSTVPDGDTLSKKFGGLTNLDVVEMVGVEFEGFRTYLIVSQEPQGFLASLL